jgi:hypothetical protein
MEKHNLIKVTYRVQLWLKEQKVKKLIWIIFRKSNDDYEENSGLATKKYSHIAAYIEQMHNH